MATISHSYLLAGVWGSLWFIYHFQCIFALTANLGCWSPLYLAAYKHCLCCVAIILHFVAHTIVRFCKSISWSAAGKHQQPLAGRWLPLSLWIMETRTFLPDLHESSLILYRPYTSGYGDIDERWKWECHGGMDRKWRHKRKRGKLALMQLRPQVESVSSFQCLCLVMQRCCSHLLQCVCVCEAVFIHVHPPSRVSRHRLTWKVYLHWTQMWLPSRKSPPAQRPRPRPHPRV